jgi:DNA polymerase-1
VDEFTREPFIVLADLIKLRQFFADESVIKVFHNAKFDIRMLEKIGVGVKGPIEETMFLAGTLNTMEPSLKLKELGRKYLGISVGDQEDLHRATISGRAIGKRLGWALGDEVAQDYWMAPWKLCKKYAITDAERTMMLFLIMKEDLDKDRNARKTYERELALWPTTYAMEGRGVRVDIDIIDTGLKKSNRRSKKFAAKIHAMVGSVNLNSPQQLCKIFYGSKKKGGLGLRITKYTKTGNPSCDQQALEKMHHPVAKLLLKWKAEDGLRKFFANYKSLAVWEEKWKCWVIHPNFTQTETKTFRFSCRQPNLQNVPDADNSKSMAAIQARTPFGPRKGYVWYHWDYKQLEVVVFADCSQEPSLLEAIASGREIHVETGNRVWGPRNKALAIRAARHALELDTGEPASSPEVKAAQDEYWDVTPKKTVENWLYGWDWKIIQAEASIGKKNTKTNAKGVTFNKIFGGGVNGLQAFIPVTWSEGEDILDAYDNSFPTIGKWIKKRSNKARKLGYVRTREGTKLMVDREKPYVAINYEVQGTAAEMLKNAMIRLAPYLQRLRDKNIDVWLVLTIHDELVIEMPTRIVGKTRHNILKRITGIMENQSTLNVPVKVEIERTDKSWAKKVEVTV